MHLTQKLAWAAVVLTAAPLAAYTVPQLIGLEAYVVESSSMEPEFSKGSAVFVEEVESREVDEGDVVVFRPNASRDLPERVIHRVIEKERDDLFHRFRTKGDANLEPDPGSTPGYRIEGEKVFSVPVLGSFVSVAGSASFLSVLIAFTGFLTARRFLVVILKAGEPEETPLDRFMK